MSFFDDAMGDPLIAGGVIKVRGRRILYDDGFSTYEEVPFNFKARKSCQPLSPDEAQLMGFGDYGVNEFMTIFALQEIPMPSNQMSDVIVRFNQRDWYVRKVLPWIWDKGTPLETGYYEVTLSRFNEREVNPNGSEDVNV